MNLKGIKKNSALNFLKKNIKKRDSNRINSLRKIEKIIILAESDLLKTYDFTKKLSENFGISKRNFDVLLYNNEYGEGSLDEYMSFTEKDFSFSCKIKNAKLKKIITNKYDLLIDYSPSGNVFAQVVCFYVNSVLKAGFENEEFDMYDISIKLESNKVDTFNEELTKYLQILNLLKK
ncbi:MAG: hypothetical protein L3J08_01330 [Flavobacteriaceae bacterium]|nr:hypothetical protein [Flavobacteriaceae bacterium]